jgi:hypothetical protein
MKQDWCPNPECSNGIKGCDFQPYDEHFVWIKCVNCERWFKTQTILDVHTCMSTEISPPIHGFDTEEECDEYLEKNRIEFRKRLENDKS